MKKIVMLLMVSVFLMAGGMFESMAQKAKNVTSPEIFLSPSSIVAKPTETVSMTYFIKGLDETLYNLIYVVFQKPDGKLMLLCTIGRIDGIVRYRNPEMIDRVTVSYDSVGNKGVINIGPVKVEDTGDYYVAVGDGNAPMFWSLNTRLVVNSNYFSFLNKEVVKKK